MPWYLFLLSPLAFCFDLVTRVRNFLYDQGIFKSKKSPIPTLVVGNLSVGGTGKTPHVVWFLERLKDDFRLASLSRGYGRQSQGFLQANLGSTTQVLGDEPHQIYHKFQREIPVFVGESRVLALEKMRQIDPKLNLAILDDAFQHRSLKGDFYVLLTPFRLPFFRDFLMPLGRLRESRSGARRADVIVVTKCPDSISEAEKQAYIASVRSYAGQKPVYFSALRYGHPYPVSSKSTSFSAEVILVSALADDSLFRDYAVQNFTVLESIHFRDHHHYSWQDAEKITLLAKKHPSRKPVILTTEKDAHKLKSLADQGFLGEIAIFALPITVKLEPNEEELLLCIIREKFNTK